MVSGLLNPADIVRGGGGTTPSDDSVAHRERGQLVNPKVQRFRHLENAEARCKVSLAFVRTQTRYMQEDVPPWSPVPHCGAYAAGEDARTDGARRGPRGDAHAAQRRSPRGRVLAYRTTLRCRSKMLRVG